VLSLLQIRDFAIVESVDVEFGPGFTALTGETGAGKSILVDALLLAVGGRADSGAVRHEADRAEVTACFDVSANELALAWLAEQQIGHEGEVLLRRTVSADGRSRAYVNGQAVPVQSLRALGELLVDVHGQLEFQSISKRSHQRTVLDESGGLQAQCAAMRTAFLAWQELDRARSAFEERGRDREHRIELLEHYVAELESLDPKTGEPERIADERRRVAALGRLAEGTSRVEELLAGDADAVGAALGRAQSILRPLVSLDEALHEIARLVDEADIASREAISALARYRGSLESDPARQEWIESRLAALEQAARKHRVDPEELPALRQRLAGELHELKQGSIDLADLEQRLSTARATREASAARLRAARRATAHRLDQRVTTLIRELGMPGGSFETRIEAMEPGHCGEHGADEVEFHVSANPGQPLRPMARVASGGELSRISLALQVATVTATHLPCLVFDEVDAGVGGAVAEMVGRQLQTLAATRQVLCVTHLAQVAAQADRQLRVTKHAAGGSTRTAVEMLSDSERVEELARMLGGTVITATTRRHAGEMLESLRRSTAGGVRAAAVGAGNRRGRTGRAGSASDR